MQADFTLKESLNGSIHEEIKRMSEPWRRTVYDSHLPAWPTGASFRDLQAYIKLKTKDGYPADEVAQSVCGCGNIAFRLEASAVEGCARRECQACRARAFLADSEEYWDDTEPVEVHCTRCDGAVFEIGVAFSKRDSGEVRWITVGVRCLNCNALDIPVDWEVDYAPTDHLIDRV